MKQLDLEFPKTKYNFLEHVIGHDAINMWNSSQKEIEDCFQSIRQSQGQIEEMQSLIKWLEERKKKHSLSFTERKSLVRLEEMICETYETIDLSYKALDCFLRSQDNVYHHVQKRMLEEINRSDLTKNSKKGTTELRLV